MPRKTSNKRSNKKRKTRKQKLYVMRGCSNNRKSCKNKKSFSSLGKGNNNCPKCGPNCHCGPNCKCPHKCPGTCYLNRRLKGGSSSSSGCGSCGCPIAPYPMNGGYPLNEIPPATAPLNYGEILGTGQNGGTCTACGQIPVTSSTQSGGNFFKPIGPMPGDTVGSAWGAAFSKWPGVNDIGGDRNYLKSYNANNNIIGKDPQLQMSLNDAGYKSMYSKVGGYRYNTNTSPSSTSSTSSTSNTLSDSETNSMSNSMSNSNTKSKSKSKRRTKSNYNSVKGGSLVPQDLLNLGSDFTFNLKSAYNAFNGYTPPVDPSPYRGQLTNLYNNGRVVV